MHTYTDLNELYNAVLDHDFDSVDFNDRKKLIESVVSNYFRNEMMAEDSSYRFRYLLNIPILGEFLINRRINNNIKWIDKVFPVKRCVGISAEAKYDLINHFEEYKKAFALFEDTSKQKLLDLLSLKLSGNFEYALKHYNTDPQYLSKKITWKKNPNIIDAGGFIGDTLIQFIDNGIIPREYYIYELEDGNYSHLLRNIKKAEKFGCVIHPRKKGVYSKDGELYYVADNDSSLIVDYPTNDKIEVVKIDTDVKCPIDFLKMDIEGSEAEALRGASEVIRKYAPTLAICVYHLKDDYWRIPLLIKEINPEYSKFWIEHYQLGYNETVLYVSK